MKIPTKTNGSYISSMKEILNNLPDISIKSKKDTIAVIFGKHRDENFISDWLAYLLQENNKVLEGILNFYKFKAEVNDYSVFREYTFKGGNRIDILIESDAFVIGIENKIDASKQLKQLYRYNKSIKDMANGRDVLLIFLKPSSNQAQATHGFKEMKYDELALVLKTVEINFIENLRYSFLLQDFIEHVEENFMSKKNDHRFNEWTNFVGIYQDRIETFTKAGRTEKVNLLSYIQMEIHSLVDFSEEWEFSKVLYSRNFLQFYKKVWKQDLDIHFELYIKNGLYLPEKVVVRVDVEGDVPLLDKTEAAQELGLRPTSNDISEIIKINYSSEDEFNKSILKLKTEFKKVIDSFEHKIDSVYNEWK